MRDTRRFVESSLHNLQKLLNKNPKLARAEFARHVRKIVLTPTNGTYVGVGDWNLFGVVFYGGAGGPACTILPQAKFFVDFTA